MPRSKLWSKRRQPPQENADVYQYDVLPDAFRKQVIYILISTLGAYDDRYSFVTSHLAEPSANQVWKTLVMRFAEEIGEFQLGDARNNPYAQCSQYLLTAPTKDVLDFIDFAFRYIDSDLRWDPEYSFQMPGGGFQYSRLDEAIEKLNQRFEEHRIGYQFQNGQLIKRTDQYVHEEFEHHLIPSMLESQFTQLRGLLETGLPTVRNRTSGHGQGAAPIVVPKFVAEYALHLAAANIVFLVHANEAYEQDNR